MNVFIRKIQSQALVLCFQSQQHSFEAMRAQSLNFFRKKRTATALTDSTPSSSGWLDLHILFFAGGGARLQDFRKSSPQVNWEASPMRSRRGLNRWGVKNP